MRIPILLNNASTIYWAKADQRLLASKIVLEYSKRKTKLQTRSILDLEVASSIRAVTLPVISTSC